MANYNLNQAIDLFNQDQVRTQTMYEVKFHSGFTKIDNTLERLQVYANNFTLPERTVNFEDLQYRAYKIPIPTTIDMGQDHSITVYADVRGDLRRACLDWQAACINPDITDGSFFEANRRPTRLGPGGDQEPWIQVDLLAPDYKTVIESTLIHGPRVTKVGGLELSNTAGSISTFTCDFKSVYWEQIHGAPGAANEDSNRNTLLGQGNADGDYQRATEDAMFGGGGNRYAGSGGYSGQGASALGAGNGNGNNYS